MEIKDLSKYDSLVKIININLELKGYQQPDMKKEIDELFSSLPEKSTSDDLVSKLSEKLIKLMEVSIDSDKTEIKNFIKAVVDFHQVDIIQIHNQLLNYIENIKDQSILTNRGSNRAIRSYIQDCKDILNERLKKEDIPSDKVISMEKFEKIFEETKLQLKDTQLDILLYQMKKAVPKGRNFNTLNAIVIVDFLK